MTHIFLKLVKFILLTRFSRPTLALFLVFALLSGVGFLTPGTSTPTLGPPYPTIGVLAFLVFVSTLGAGIIIFKSDTDYLLTLPVDRTQLALALFLAQFLGSAGITVFFIAPTARLLAAGTTTEQALTIVSLLLLSLFATSISVVGHRLGTLKRVLLATVLALWIVSPLFGFPFSPSSVLTGNFVTGTLASVLAASLAFSQAFRDLSTVRVGIFRTITRTTTGTYGSQRSFLGASPLRALYRYHLTLVELAGRVNLAGSTSYRASRTRIELVVAVTSVLAVVYGIFVSNLVPIIPPNPGGSPVGQNIILSVATIGLTIAIPATLAQSGVANERAWLALTSMPSPRYLRHFLATRFLSTLIILAPFVLVDLAVFVLGNQIGLNSALCIALFAPCSSVLMTYLSARVYPFQIKELGLQPAQYSLRQMLIVLPAFATVAFVGLALVSLPFAIISSLVFLVPVGIILRSNGMLQGLVFNMTEKGFV